ncbi:hypothetical protein RHGRI_010315 [Rhododendron griersonianum]|uniref:DUF4283 domain-containing protein n=1 Tax=Rhododendron griersonianum TaxID=479676 RepID=A0AAV6KI49_9ERIC|nr:hypothetical protein RHGRI_010315 [Rhododendron griersonianum]
MTDSILLEAVATPSQLGVIAIAGSPVKHKVAEVISRVSEGVERNVAFELLDDGLQKVFGQLEFGNSDDTVVRQIKALAAENLVLHQRAEDTFSKQLLDGSKVDSSLVGPVANPVGISGQFEARPTPLSVPVVAAGADPGSKAKVGWNTVVAQSLPSASRMALAYHPPQIRGSRLVVCPPIEVEECGAERWSDCLVGYFLDKKVSFHLVDNIVKRIWKKFGIYEVMANDQGFFFFKFGDEGVLQKVMEGGPWHIAGKLMILKKWQPQMVLQKEQLSSIPIWVQLCNVPLEFWNAAGFSYIASALGKPLFVDEQTEKGKRLSFAKVCVEMTVDSPFLDTVDVEYASGKSAVVGVKYPWKPLVCTQCHVFGHSVSSHKSPLVATAIGDQVGLVSEKEAISEKEVVLPLDLGVDCGTSVGQVEVAQGRASLAAKGPGASTTKDLAVQVGSDPPVIGGWETPVFQQDRPRAGKAPAGVVLKEPVGILHTVAQVSVIAKAASKVLTGDVNSSQLSNTFAVLDSTVTVEGQLQVEEGMVPHVSLSLRDSPKPIPPIVDPGAKKKPRGRGKK